MRTVCFEKNIPKILLAKTLRSIWPGIVNFSLSPTQFKELPDEPLPAPHWIRVRNLLCGICASDLHPFLAEADPAIADAALPGTNRLFLGHEVVGLVSEIGAEVSTLKLGDRVIMDSRALA